jgi:PleD family two-component response regulator
MTPAHGGPPQILLVSHHGDVGLELHRIAARHGHSLLRAFTATQALEYAQNARPHVIIVDEALPDLASLDAGRALRDDPLVGPSTPILLITAGRPTTAEHHAALRAGVWEFLVHPFNPEEVATKLDIYVRLKLDADRAHLSERLDDGLGLYTTRGLALRARELTLQAFHHGAPLACVALAPVAREGQGTSAVELVSQVLRTSGRRSDAIGRIGLGEFAVVAPGTDAHGAVLLAKRLAGALQAAAPGRSAPQLRAGYDAVVNTRYTPIEPKSLLGRATNALRVAKASADADWIQAFAG